MTRETIIENRIIKRFKDVFKTAPKECSQKFKNNLCSVHLLVCAYICGQQFKRYPVVKHGEVLKELERNLYEKL
jgi:hypothetical protein